MTIVLAHPVVKVSLIDKLEAVAKEVSPREYIVTRRTYNKTLKVTIEM